MKKVLSLLFMVLVLILVSVSSFADEAVLQATVVLNDKTPTPTYDYLKGTRYKNLIQSKYQNLYETTIPPEPVVEEPEQITQTQGQTGTQSSGTGSSKRQVASTSDPGFSGSSGGYSMSDCTVAAHLTVMGTSIQNRAVYQCSTSSTYFESSSYAWAAKTAHLRSGTISQNTVIYGHNWKNCFAPFKTTGTQFESLMALTYWNIVSNNQYIYLTTNTGVYTYKIFAVSFTKDTSFYIKCNNIDVASIASRAKSMSLFDFGVSVGSGDSIITLSTCTRYYSGLGANQRFIVMGKLVSVS